MVAFAGGSFWRRRSFEKREISEKERGLKIEGMAGILKEFGALYKAGHSAETKRPEEFWVRI